MKSLYKNDGNRTLLDCPRRIPTCLVPAGVLDTLGHTPLLPIKSACQATGCKILAKAEYMNPGGSVKDRIARFIVTQAEQRGELKPGGTILEVTSGNTGIALSMVGAIKGYKVVVVMPASVSAERRNMIQAFGAELRLIERLTGIQAAVEEAEQQAVEDPMIFLPRQFSNPDNALCHQQTTGAEILAQLSGPIDAFVTGVGTGGTLMGVARALSRAGQRCRIVAVEAAESAVMSGEAPGEHGIQGLADGFIPELVRLDAINEVATVTTSEARERAKRLAQEDGLLVGISAGANLVATERVAERMGPGHTLVTILPDRGERYLSV
ncbi:MAG: cysteine synthase family protein [Candidatus Eremiobacteraeota bacterium]|nr:cysteine synthase family protein [Candidatus Eremiobacteraeota bacterium]